MTQATAHPDRRLISSEDVQGNQAQSVVKRTPVYAGHRDHDSEQQTQSEAGQDEAEKVMPDVSVGEVHRWGCSPATVARPTRSPPGKLASTRAPSGMPSRISIRPSSMR
jgi:hypothetical protein